MSTMRSSEAVRDRAAGRSRPTGDTGRPPAPELDITPQKQPMDKLLLILTITLIGVGIVSVFDASYATEVRRGHSEYYMVAKQIRWAILGLAALIVCMRVPYWRWRRHAFAAACVAVVALALVFVPHVGHIVNGARRWIGPTALMLQPSEFAKLALVLYVAHICTVKGLRMRDFQSGLLPPLGMTAVTCALIAKEPDLGTAMVLCGTVMIMLYVAGARGRHLGTLLGVVGAVVFFYSIAKPYRLHRLISFVNPQAYQMGDGYQVWHSLVAIGSGGIGGRGLGDGIEKIFIPMAPTDFIFPVIAEEWGLVGSLVVITLFLLVAARGFSIGHSTNDRFGSLLAAGVTSLICLQSAVNIAVATSSIPNTGVPLPFISYGGSALILMMGSVGLLLNISRYPDGPGRPETADGPPRANEREFENRWSRHSYLPKENERPAAPDPWVDDYYYSRN
ncbi:MAG: putative lipid II flippase FtsW [Capsulimonadaceae bacterium]